jgi:hypothetical protein
MSGEDVEFSSAALGITSQNIILSAASIAQYDNHLRTGLRHPCAPAQDASYGLFAIVVENQVGMFPGTLQPALDFLALLVENCAYNFFRGIAVTVCGGG